MIREGLGDRGNRQEMLIMIFGIPLAITSLVLPNAYYFGGPRTKIGLVIFYNVLLLISYFTIGKEESDKGAIMRIYLPITLCSLGALILMSI